MGEEDTEESAQESVLRELATQRLRQRYPQIGCFGKQMGGGGEQQP